MFDASAHNERIKYIYGNYCFWSWFRYWYLDSANFVTMMLVDKGFFDYDYEKIEKQTNWEDTIKTEEEVNDILSIFGLGKKTKEEEIQELIIKEENYAKH